MSIAPQRQAVSLHTHSGVQLFQYLPENTSALSWSRELRDVSICTIKLPADDHLDRLTIVPWLHWVSVWDADGDKLLWTGPIQNPSLDRESLSIKAVDCSALAARTRVPITKRWDAVDPSQVASELWDAMIVNHNLNIDPIVRPDPEGEPFDFSVEADTEYVSDVIDKLVTLGFRWTVVAGIPLLGPAGKKSVGALSENDFLGAGLQLSRDGSKFANDILLRAADSKVYARVEAGGLNMQSIVNVNDLSGPSNAERATLEQARHYGKIRDSITVPGGTPLHPDAAVRIEELIPSARWSVEGFGQLTLMELESIQVDLGADATNTSVSMDQVVEVPELEKLAGASGPSS